MKKKHERKAVVIILKSLRFAAMFSAYGSSVLPVILVAV